MHIGVTFSVSLLSLTYKSCAAARNHSQVINIKLVTVKDLSLAIHTESDKSK